MDISASSAALSALAAVASAVTAGVALKSASKSATATEGLTALERERRHSELTPVFQFSLTEDVQGVQGQGELSVTLVGPTGLDYLDEVTLRILDESGKDHWAHGLPGGVTQEEADAFVWGPWKFATQAGAQIADGRTSKTRTYSRVDGKNWDRLPLRSTIAGHWMGDDTGRWRREQAGKPIRLSIECRRAPYDPWFLLYEIAASPQG